MIQRLILAVVVAVVTGLVLVGLLGPLLVGMHVPIAVTVGDFLVAYGWVLALCAGLWWFFGSSGLVARFRTPPAP